MPLFRTHPFSKAFLLGAALGAGLWTAGVAAEEPAPVPELASETSDQLNDAFRPAFDAKDWDKALAALDVILPKVPADSYDAAWIFSTKATLCENKNDPVLALQNMDRALAIDDRKHYFDKQTKDALLYMISQYSYSEAVTTKDTISKGQFFARAVETLERWLGQVDSRSLNQDNYYFIAAVYFALGQGAELGSEPKLDKPMMEKALVWVDRGLRSAIHPRDSFYQLKIAGLLQLGRMNDAAECIELQLKQKPDNRGFWQQLASIYLQLAQAAEEKKETTTSYSYYVRTIVTIERAQKLGFMNTPQENFSLVSVYTYIDQYSIAAELLDNGMRQDTIESKPQNWTTLGEWYQLIHREDKAVATFLTAVQLFPTNADVEYQLARVYLNSSDDAHAFEHIKACIAKGGTDKPHVGWLFYAYTALDLQKFDEALKGANQALDSAKKLGDTDAIKQAEKMIQSINGNMADIENRKQQMKH